MVRVVVALALLVLPAVARPESPTELEHRSRAFYQLLEHGEKDRASAVFPELERTLAQTAANLRADLDRMRDEVADNDGDLAALYRSSGWREPEIGQMVVAYHLAWVRYQGAQLSEPARKQQLLKQAVEGFSQFLLLGEVPEIYADCLYGRGLAYMDLGDRAKASEDLEEAATDQRTQGKARVALEELRRRSSGKAGQPAADDPEVLLAKLGELLPRTATEISIEKDATALARGLAARGGAWPQRVQSLVTGKLGSGTATSVRSSYGLFLLGQLAIDQGRCADVGPLVEAGAGVPDPGRTRWRPELLFLAGGCRLNAGRAREAADQFTLLLRDFPDAPRAPEAAYYRLRALDVARVEDPGLMSSYEDAVTAYLAKYPKGNGAAEAHFMLGELQRNRGECPQAVQQYALVTAGSQVALARLGVLQCQVATLPTAPAQSGPARAAILEAVRAFVRDTPARGDDTQVVARAVLLGAAVAAGATPPNHAAVVDLLEGFEGRFAAAREYHTRALELRLRARIERGQIDAAVPDLDAYLRAEVDEDGRRLLGTIGRELAAQADRAGDEQGRPARVLARRVYETLVAAGGSLADRIMLADFELRSGDPTGARKRYESVLAQDPTSAEALRGAARAAAASGDRDAALAHWRQVVESSPTGGTGWYEARLAQVALLAEGGRRPQACVLIRSSRGRATSAGADALEARLRALEPDVCR